MKTINRINRVIIALLFIGFAVVIFNLLTAQTLTKKQEDSITRQQLLSLPIIGSKGIIVHPEELTVEGALQWADSIHQIEVRRYREIIDSLENIIDKR